MIKLIEDTASLEAFCAQLQNQKFITIDLEFIREKTYYAELALIQVGSEAECAIIDPLAQDLNMHSFFLLLENPKIEKVFHAGHQDIEILYMLTHKIPYPVFDTQIVAQVCGFGENVSYENLVKSICGIELDKSYRVSNWLQRPLSERQLEYALADVTHLIKIYRHLKSEAEKNNRMEWLKEEMENVYNPDTYIIKPEDAWMRLRARSHHPFFLTVLRELCAWRERRAQSRNITRQVIIKDDCLANIASLCPHNHEELAQIRGMRKDIADGKLAAEIIDIICKCDKIPPEDYVVPPKEKKIPGYSTALYELLKLLLKLKAQEHQVVARLIAHDDDLKEFASAKNDARNPILKGWRKEVFGEAALALRSGKISISYNPKSHKIEIK